MSNSQEGSLFGPDVEDAALGFPEGAKILKADFLDKFIDGVIESRGPRFAWSRATLCPCRSVDGQTRNSNPNCAFCGLNAGGTPGFLFFRPLDYEPENVPEIGQLTKTQEFLINRDLSPAVVVRGLVTSVARREEAFERLGDWVWGSYNITMRRQNKINYMDRLTCLDAEMGYSQLVHMPKTGPLILRFPATRVAFLGILHDKFTKLSRFEQDKHFELDDDGRVHFEKSSRPVEKALISIHYNHHPQFIVVEHVNAFRESLQRSKVAEATKVTPAGNPQHLPIRGMAKLEFLLGAGAAQ